MGLGFTDHSDLAATDRNRPVVVVCRLMTARDKSLLVVDGAGVSAWLARSLILKSEDGGGGDGGAFTRGTRLRLTLPAWLAEEKGLSVQPGEGQGDLF